MSLFTGSEVSRKFGATVMPSSGDITGEALDSGYGNDAGCVWNLEATRKLISCDVWLVNLRCLKDTVSS